MISQHEFHVILVLFFFYFKFWIFLQRCTSNQWFSNANCFFSFIQKVLLLTPGKNEVSNTIKYENMAVELDCFLETLSCTLYHGIHSIDALFWRSSLHQGVQFKGKIKRSFWSVSLGIFIKSRYSSICNKFNVIFCYSTLYCGSAYTECMGATYCWP